MKLNNKMQKWFNDHEAELVAIRHYLHQYPELSFQEFRTSEYIAKLCESWGYKVKKNFGKTGIVCQIKNGPSKKIVGIRAEMDALPIQEENKVTWKSKIKGISHMCGHDGHMTMALACAKYFSFNKNFNGTINFYFQPSEEISTSGAQAMVKDQVLKQFPCDLMLALHGLPTTSDDNNHYQEGAFYYLEGPKALFAAGDTYYLEVIGHGGHSSYPDKTKDPIVAAANLIMSLQTIVSRNVPPNELGIVSVGTIEAPGKPIVIPQTVKLSISTRASNNSINKIISKRIYEIISGVQKTYSVKIKVKHEGFPATVCDQKLSKWVKDLTAKKFGNNSVGDALFQTAGEDICYFFEQVPGCYALIGNGTTKTGVHENKYDFNDKNIIRGGMYYANIVENYFQSNVKFSINQINDQTKITKKNS